MNIYYISSNLMPSSSSAARHARKKAAANVPLASLFAIEAAFSVTPCDLSRVANSSYVMVARLISALRNRRARSSQLWVSLVIAVDNSARVIVQRIRFFRYFASQRSIEFLARQTLLDIRKPEAPTFRE